MAVVTKISVGDVMYYQVDDIPSHTAPKGSVAMMVSGSTYSNGFTYVNNNGGSVWLKCISPSYGKMSLTNATNTVDFDTQVTTSFYAFNGTPTGGSWVRVPISTDDWILATENSTTDDLKYTGSTIMRAYVHSSTTVRGGASKWVSHNITTAQNFAVVTTSVNQYYTADNGATASCGHTTIREINPNDYVLIGINPVVRESGGGASSRLYIPKHGQISVTKIDEPLISVGTTTLLDEDWESNSFTANTWNVVNDTTNQWVIGTAQVDTGTYGLYGSNDGGTTANYSNAGDVSHIYKDFTFPADATNITLTFVWRSFMEDAGAATQYDYGTVNIIDTSTTPVAGTEVETALATAGGNGRLNQNGTDDGKFNEGYRYGGTYDGTWFTETIDLSAYAGTTKRLVFTVKDDGAAPADAPAMSIDNILLTYGGGNVY
jgi:hypothetical protein